MNESVSRLLTAFLESSGSLDVSNEEKSFGSFWGSRERRIIISCAFMSALAAIVSTNERMCDRTSSSAFSFSTHAPISEAQKSR